MENEYKYFMHSVLKFFEQMQRLYREVFSDFVSRRRHVVDFEPVSNLNNPLYTFYWITEKWIEFLSVIQVISFSKLQVWKDPVWDEIELLKLTFFGSLEFSSGQTRDRFDNNDLLRYHLRFYFSWIARIAGHLLAR